MECFQWLFDACARESRGVVNYEQLGREPLPVRFTGDDPGWQQAEDGFRNVGADCYIICAVQMLGALRMLRRAILSDIPLRSCRVLAALHRDSKRTVTPVAPFCHVAVECSS